jgi:uncharacterized protein (TIRG00374 family)
VRGLLLKRALIYLIAVACLVWVFHDVHPQQLLAAMTISNWWFVILAVVVDILTYGVQGIRWKLLLSPIGHLSVLRSTQAIYAGLFANELLPLRFGELVRGFLVSRWLSSRLTAVVPSIIVERILDALWLAVGVSLAALFVSLPADLIEVGHVLGAVLLAITGAFLWIILRKKIELESGRPQPASSSGIVSRLLSLMARLVLGLHQIGTSRLLCFAALLSPAMLVCQALAFWFMMRACGIHLPLVAGVVVMLIVRLGTIIPNAPANVGSFQFFAVLALGLFAVPKTTAAGFSIVIFVALTVPLWTLGLFAISCTGMSLSTIRGEVAGLRGWRSHHSEPRPRL